MSASRFQTTVVDQAVSSATNFGVALFLLLTTSVAEFGRFGFAVTLALVVLSVTRAVASEPFVLQSHEHPSSRADSDATALLTATATGITLLVVSWLAVGLTGATICVCLGAGILGIQDHRRYVSFAHGKPEFALKSDSWWFAATIGLLALLQPVLPLVGIKMSASVAAACWVFGAAVAHAKTSNETSFVERLENVRGSARRWLKSTSRLGKSFLGELVLERASFQIGMIAAASYLIASDFGSLRVAHFVYGPLAVFAGGLYTYLLSEFGRRSNSDQKSLVRRSIFASWALVIGTAPIWIMLPSSLVEIVPWDSSASVRGSLTLAHLTYGGWIVGAIGRARLRSTGSLKASAGIRTFNGALFIVGVLAATRAPDPLLGFLAAFAVASLITAVAWTIAAIYLPSKKSIGTDLSTLPTINNPTSVSDSPAVLDITEEAPVTHVISGLKFFDNGALIGGHANALRGLVHAQSLQANDNPRNRPEVLPLRSMRSKSVGFGAVVHDGGLRSFWQTVVRNPRKGVLHFHVGYLDYVLMAQLSRLARFERVIVTHYCPAPLYQPDVLPSLRGRVMRWMSRGVEHISISENVQKALARVGIDSDVLAPAVDLRGFNELELERKSNSATRFLFVGNLREEKNLVGCIRAFGRAAANNPNIRLVATIEDYDLSSSDYGKLVAKEIARWGVEDKVETVGVVEDMPELMGQCDAMVLPFLGTRGPSDYFLAGLEGLAAGLPLICSDVGAMAEIVDNSCGRLVEPSAEEELAQAILAFADGSLPKVTPTKRSEIVETFSPARIATQMKSIYQEMEPAR